MKKIIALVIALTLLFSLCSCAKTGEKESPASNQNSQTELPVTDAQQTQSPEVSTETTARQSHQEYVETYFIYAESGAVVTWFDSQTGEFTYKWKCESCGTTLGGETSGHRLTASGSSLDSSFTCTNPNCEMWGKSQRAIIKCNVDGKWVDVYD